MATQSVTWGPFVQHCAANGGTCITFNYDDFLDEAFSKSPIWNPEWGYGFYCPSAAASVSASTEDRLIARMLLLKLHGSLNWRARLGYTAPYALGAITHHQDWAADIRSDPPSTHRTALGARAGDRAAPSSPNPGSWSSPSSGSSGATHSSGSPRPGGVTFIGYSFPQTDTAARILFAEAMRDVPRSNIRVVGLEESDVDKNALKARYRDVLDDIPDDSFFFDGARRWVEQLDA